MDKRQITQVVRDVIDDAAQAKGWSLAQLTRKLGKGENTLHRWRNGSTTTYDLETLVSLFSMADVSMDEAFHLTGAAVEPAGTSTLGRLEDIESELAEIHNQLTALQPAIKLLGVVQWLAESDQQLPDYSK